VILAGVPGLGAVNSFPFRMVFSVIGSKGSPRAALRKGGTQLLRMESWRVNDQITLLPAETSGGTGGCVLVVFHFRGTEDDFAVSDLITSSF